MNMPVQIKEVKDGVPTEVLQALNNIKNTMRIRAEKGSEEAAFILKHL
jgi:hypothetical protein